MAEKTRSRSIATQPPVSRPELLVGNSDHAFRQFVHDTLAFSARLQQVRSQLGQVIGLSGTQYTVLIAIAHLQGEDEKVGVNLVADHLHFSGAFITIEMNKLVVAGGGGKEKKIAGPPARGADDYAEGAGSSQRIGAGAAAGQ